MRSRSHSVGCEVWEIEALGNSGPQRRFLSLPLVEIRGAEAGGGLEGNDGKQRMAEGGPEAGRLLLVRQRDRVPHVHGEDDAGSGPFSAAEHRRSDGCV